MEMMIVLFGVALTAVVHGQDQSGFISVDCGTNSGSSYFDSITEIYYVSDSKFVDTGINYNVSEEYSSRLESADQQLMNVRSFPEGTKNCYTLQPILGKNHKYLIRASFMYGNYDSKNQLPVFKLYLGVDEWDTVKFNNSYDIIRKEIIYVPQTDEIYVCLVNTGSGSPFISALELRQLNSSIYTVQSGSLMLFRRLDIGSTRNETIRYKDDAFDRFWEPFSHPDLKSMSTFYSGDISSDNYFKPPSKVMETAVTPADEINPLEFQWNLDNSTRHIYVYLHFSEIEELQSNQLREFYVSLNGWFLTPEPIVPGWLVPRTGFSANSISASSLLSLSIHKTDRSTLPPILNALEIYEIKQLSHSSTVQSDVDAIKKIKMVYKVKKNWQGDPCLPTEFSWDGLSCSDSSSISPSIISLNISWSKLTGEIDSSFSNLTSLKYLDLSYNNLTGQVPNFLSNLPSLKTLILSGNNLTGSVPLALLEKSVNRSLSLRLDGNPNLCKKNFCEDEEEDKENTKNDFIDPVVASIISVLALLLGEVAVFWIFKRRKQYGDMTLDSKNRHLSYSEVERITKNFKKMFGQGASGKVFLGHLSDDTEVAIKMLIPSSILEFKRFKTEVQLLTKIHHKNLVSLIGYCDKGSNMVLVYEHMGNGSLKEYLSGGKGVGLSWEQRLRTAIDAAQALDYLHDGCNPPIIHGDVKTENILFNKNFEAKVADFGWPRSMPFEGGSCASCAIVGTPGCVDPEYSRTSVPSKKTDIYSFGIVLLELTSGRPTILGITEDSTCSIADWAHLVISKGDIKMIIDPMLQGEFESQSLRRAIEIAMSCVSLNSTERPTMTQIVLELKECLKLAIAHEKLDSVEEDQDPISIEAVYERTDNVEQDHNPFGGAAAHEEYDDAEVDHGLLGVEAAHEVTNNAKEDEAHVGIVTAHKRNDNGKVDQGHVVIGVAHERHENRKEDHGRVSIAVAYEITDNAEEEQSPVGIDATKERTHIMDVVVGMKAAHVRNDNGEEDHGPIDPAATHKSTDTVVEDCGHLGIQAVTDVQESTNLDERAKGKKNEKEKNVVIPAVASISPDAIPSDNVVVKHHKHDKTFEPKNRFFSYSEVERITDNFRKELGKGASATVYHGHLSNGTEVAVKKLSPSLTLGLKQFRTEAQLLTRVHHKNLVSLFGYCDEGSNMVLIYEYMAFGNLKVHLSGKREAVLSWEQRLQIAIDAAQALEYLHNGCNPPIIHRDVKTENILLNEKLRAKMADFGWSKSMPAEDGSCVSTAIVGTVGYLDPEYYRNSVPTEKSDVYSFGIVLLELISNRPAIIKNTKDDPCNISDWVRPIIAKGDIRMIVDPRLQGRFKTNSARRAIETAMSCVSLSPTDRPTSSDIVVELRECLKMAMANERTKNWEEGQGSVDIEAAISVQESLDGNQDFLKTGSNGNAGERKEEENKKRKKIMDIICPAVASITSALVPSGGLSSLGKSKMKWPQAKVKRYLEVTRMSYLEVASITHNFQQLIGQNNFGYVYLGHLSLGTKVAVVKRFSQSNIGSQDFQTEAEQLSQVRHRNLVSLLGYCNEGSTAVLIYEYMVNKSLREYLSDDNKAVLSWKERVGIALDAAQGLEYLHKGFGPSIIHGDVTSANILLNEKLQAKVGGIGVSKSFLRDFTANSDSCATFQYLDPEFFESNTLNEKSDVYSFGFVLLELVTSRLAILRNHEVTHLVDWIRHKLETGEIASMIDSRLHRNFHFNSARKLLETAMICAARSGTQRPTMSEVVVVLKDCLQMITASSSDSDHMFSAEIDCSRTACRW